MLAGKVMSAVASTVVSTFVNAGAQPIIELVRQSETAVDLAENFKSAVKSIGELAGIAKTTHSLDKKRFDKIAEALNANFCDGVVSSHNPIKQLGSYIGVDGTSLAQYLTEIDPDTISLRFKYKFKDKEEEINLLKLVCEIGRKTFKDASKVEKEKIAKSLKTYISILILKGIEIDLNYINSGPERFLLDLGQDIDKPELGFDVTDFIVQYQMLQSDLELSKISNQLSEMKIYRQNAEKNLEQVQQQVLLAQKALSLAANQEAAEQIKHDQKKIGKYFLEIHKDFMDLQKIYTTLDKAKLRKKESNQKLEELQSKYQSKKADESKADSDTLKKAYKQDLENLTSGISETNRKVAEEDSEIVKLSIEASNKASAITEKIEIYNNLKLGLGRKALPDEAERLVQFISEAKSTNAAGFFNGLTLFLKKTENYHIVLSSIKIGKPSDYLLNTILAKKEFDLVPDFLINGAEVTKKGQTGRYPLHIIASSIESKQTVFLAQMIADLYPQALISKDDEGKTPLELALAKRSEVSADLCDTWARRVKMLEDQQQVIEKS